MNILVIDVGTSSMRGILFTQDGETLTQRQQLYQVTYGEKGWVWQDASDWENALYGIIREITAETEEKGWRVDAIAITSQRSSVIPVDREFKPLCPAIMWQDKRTGDICDSLRDKNDKVFSLCGSRVNPVFSASKMTWIRRELPEVYSKTRTFMVIPDYLIFCMTGEVCTDYTYGSRSLLMNIRKRQWDPELLELFEVDEEKLCRLIEPGSICGYTSGTFRERTGCPEGVPVITAGGDQQCGAIGQGVVKEGILSVTAGTGGFLVAALNEVPSNLEQDVICNVSSVKGQYILESSVLTCCSAFDWFKREFYGNCYKALKEDGIMVNQHESPFYEEDARACQKAHRNITESFPISKVYQAHIPTYPSGHWLFGFASKKYHPLRDLREQEWNARGLKTPYYTTTLHKGAFYISAYVEELLKHVEKEC